MSISLPFKLYQSPASCRLHKNANSIGSVRPCKTDVFRVLFERFIPRKVCPTALWLVPTCGAYRQVNNLADVCWYRLIHDDRTESCGFYSSCFDVFISMNCSNWMFITNIFCSDYLRKMESKLGQWILKFWFLRKIYTGRLFSLNH